MFKMKDGYKLQSQAPGTKKLFGSTIIIITIIIIIMSKIKNGENVPSPEVVEVVSV